MPPDICVEIALWDRFGWGPEQTRKITITELRILFAILEQQQVSRDYKERMGRGNQKRYDEIRMAQEEAKVKTTKINNQPKQG